MEHHKPAVQHSEVDNVEHSSNSKENTTLRKTLDPTLPDPNNPLHWSNGEKYLTFGTICLFSFLSTANTSKFTVAVTALAEEFQKTPIETGYLVSFSVLALGLGNFIWVAMLRLCGRRPALLLAILCLGVFNCWSAFAKSYSSLMVATVLAGIAAGGGEAPIPTVVADLFHVQQRGAMMMTFHVALSCGFFVGPAINAAIAEFVGWRWLCGWIAIAAAVNFAIGIFTIQETFYLATAQNDISADAENQMHARQDFSRRLSITSGYNKELQSRTVVWNMVSIAAYPSVLWAGLTIGTFVGWNIVVQVTAARVLVQAPYGFDLWDVGVFNFAGLIGALIAMFFGGRLIDIISSHWTARNNTVRLPEYRLPPLLIPSVIGPLGIAAFGLCLAHKTHWIGPAVGHAMQGFGLTAASNVLVTYNVDLYPMLAGEVLVVVFLVRGVTGCLLSLYAYDWVLAEGLANTFGHMAAIQCFFALFAIVFYQYGGRIRTWTSKFGPSRHLSAY